MTPDEDMALKFAVVALRNALLKRAVLSQAEIDVELGDIFAKIAIDKTLGSTLLEGSGLNFAKVEHYARTRKLPRQVDTSRVDFGAASGLGRNARGGTWPRLSWGRSVL
jgi:hypothetical protein